MNRPIAVLSLYVPIRCPRALDDFRSGMSPPGVPATWIAPRIVVQTGSDARRSSANVRHPATAQVEAVKPFVLDRLPGTTPAGHSPWSVEGRAFGACCFASKLRSPAPRTGRPDSPGPTPGP
jgi:hypothetical protein